MKTVELDFDPERTSAAGLRAGIVAARFNGDVVDRLLEGAVSALLERGAAEEDIEVVRVPGAFELPVVLRAMATSGRFDLLVALGAVVRGETPHFEHVASEAARGCGWIARRYAIPVGFGVLTTETQEQALERAGGPHGNKGAEAALSAVETVHVIGSLEAVGLRS